MAFTVSQTERTAPTIVRQTAFIAAMPDAVIDRRTAHTLLNTPTIERHAVLITATPDKKPALITAIMRRVNALAFSQPEEIVCVIWAMLALANEASATKSKENAVLTPAITEDTVDENEDHKLLSRVNSPRHAATIARTAKTISPITTYSDHFAFKSRIRCEV